jgi:hypothetical protein
MDSIGEIPVVEGPVYAWQAPILAPMAEKQALGI